MQSTRKQRTLAAAGCLLAAAGSAGAAFGANSALTGFALGLGLVLSIAAVVRKRRPRTSPGS